MPLCFPVLGLSRLHRLVYPLTRVVVSAVFAHPIEPMDGAGPANVSAAVRQHRQRYCLTIIDFDCSENSNLARDMHGQSLASCLVTRCIHSTYCTGTCWTKYVQSTVRAERALHSPPQCKSNYGACRAPVLKTVYRQSVNNLGREGDWPGRQFASALSLPGGVLYR